MRIKRFTIIPAIDLKAGRCVRLYQGISERETEYSDDPVSTALEWEKQGAERLHIVDLDGAFTGSSGNAEAVRQIVQNLSIPCQVGGGIRTTQAIERAFEWGVSSVIVGTAGVKRPGWLGEMVKSYGKNRIFAGVDCRDGQVMVEGWKSGSAVDRDDWLGELVGLGIETVVYTDISRDGTETGTDIDGIRRLLENFDLRVIASGGIGSLADIRSLLEITDSNLVGLITGKALYENNFSLESALNLVEDYSREEN